MLKFNSSPRPTIGVEVELQLLDRKTLAFRDIAPEVLSSIDPSYEKRIKEEFIKSMVELNTDICEDMAQVERDLKGSLAYLESILDGMGAVYYAASLHPLEKGTGRNVTENPRYERIMNDLQLIGRRFITQGLHVHIGVSSAERAIKINNNMRMYLPLLLALTTSSPFYAGEDTGLYSYRTKLFEALPLAGLPDSLEGWDEFQNMVALLQAGGIIESVKDIWWDVRPHPVFGTVETRICDLPCRFKEILAITALVQAMVVSLSNVHLHPDTRIQMQILRANKWQAARYGLDGVFVNPISAGRLPMRDAVDELLALLEPETEQLGSSRHMDVIREILYKGTGAHAQRRIYGHSKDFRQMMETIREGFFR